MVGDNGWYVKKKKISNPTLYYYVYLSVKLLLEFSRLQAL